MGITQHQEMRYAILSVTCTHTCLASYKAIWYECLASYKTTRLFFHVYCLCCTPWYVITKVLTWFLPLCWYCNLFVTFFFPLIGLLVNAVLVILSCSKIATGYADQLNKKSRIKLVHHSKRASHKKSKRKFHRWWVKQSSLFIRKTALFVEKHQQYITRMQMDIFAVG